MKANGAKEQIISAHDAIEAAWKRYCEANGEEIKATANRKLAAENYLNSRQTWVNTVERCTPGTVQEMAEDRHEPR